MSQLKMPKVRPGMTPVLVPMGPVNQSVAMKPHVPTVGEMLRQQKQQQVVVNRPVAPKPSAPSGQQAGFEVCEICGGYVKDRMSLQIHFFYAHKVDRSKWLPCSSKWVKCYHNWHLRYSAPFIEF